MTDLFSALLLGILEGLTEFLPISSTGHLLIAEQWLGRRSDFFNIVIQAGAILAISLALRQRLWSLATGLGDRANRDYVLKLGVSFLVTAVVGLAVRKAGWELPETVQPIAWALVIGGVWMLVAEHFAGKLPDRDAVTWKVAIAVGLAQVVAGVFPGTSRSASAIFLAMLLGLSRRSAAAEFVFLVGIPTMFAASGYAFLELYKEGAIGSENWTDVAVAFAAAVVTGFAVVRWLLGYIKSHRFTAFAVYRIVLGTALLLWLPAA
ncbi:undecaprenyl-diphosphate phosphatase [Xanthomonas sp. AmX2]|uniref:undecaprenyl-diphosphate phosphatase n=1 Tax=Xanthomonas sp. TaxID=29446 RepID=UPI0019823598|nr:undecaprenyl-diphosphate phosphatase [Xanthomonas sp.]MBN6150666.1 undecaprenyl-diphosphate phosphatase [Xanthomonas sp.]